MRKLIYLLAILICLSCHGQQRGLGFFSGASTAAGDPPVSAGLIAWFRADSITGLSDGDAISTWTDDSTNALIAVGVTTTRPVWKQNIINGHSVVRFDGTDDHLDVANTSILSPTNVSIYALCSWRGGGSGSGIIVLKNPTLSSGTALWTLYEGQSSGRTIGSYITSSSGGSFSGSAMTDGTFYYVGMTYDGTTDQLYINGTADASSGARTGNLVSGLGLFQIGGYNGSFSASEFSKIDIEEFFVYDHALSGGDQTLMNNYLKARGGL